MYLMPKQIPQTSNAGRVCRRLALLFFQKIDERFYQNMTFTRTYIFSYALETSNTGDRLD